MKYSLLTVFLFISISAQPHFYPESALIQDFSTVKGEVIAATTNEEVRAFQRFKVEQLLDTLIDISTGKLEKRVYLFCSDKEGKEHRFRVYGGNNPTAFYSTKQFEEAIKQKRNEQYVFYEKDNLTNKLSAWRTYKFKDAFYDEKAKKSIIKLMFGNQTLLLDEVEFTGDYFISSVKYNEIIKLYGLDFGRNIIRKEINLGMTPEMVLASWGAPKTQTEYISTMGNVLTYNYKNHVLSFYNGKLESIYKHD